MQKPIFRTLVRSMKRSQQLKSLSDNFWRSTTLLKVFKQLKLGQEAASQKLMAKESPWKSSGNGIQQKHSKEQDYEESDRCLTYQEKAASKQYVILQKIRLFRELLKYKRRRQTKRRRWQQAEYFWMEAIQRKAIQALGEYRCSKRVEGIQFQRALEYDRYRILRHAFLVIKQTSQIQMLVHKADYFKDFCTTPRLAANILGALKKNAIRSLSMKKAHKFYETKLMNLCFQKLTMNRQVQGHIAQRYDVSVQINDCNLLSQAFKGLRAVTIEQQENRSRAFEEVQFRKLDRLFGSFSESCQEFRVDQPMTNPSQLVCSCLWLESAFGQSSKPSKVIEIPLLLAVSQSRKYKQHFIDSNRVLRMHTMRTVLKALSKMRQPSLQFRRRRTAELLQTVFQGLRGQLQKQIGVEKISQKVAKSKDERLRRRIFRQWMDQALQLTTVKKMENASDGFHRSKSIQKFLSIWVGRMRQRTKKLSLLKNQCPKVQRQIYLRKFWKTWRGLYQKSKYLNNQYNTMAKSQKGGVMAECFKQLKEYRLKRKSTRARYEKCRQFYMYTLGRRIFRSLSAYNRKSKEKKRVYMVLQQGYTHKLGLKIFQRLRMSVRRRKEKRVEELVVYQQVANIVVKYKLRLWRRRLYQRKAVQYLEVGLDRVRAKVALNRLTCYSYFTLENEMLIMDRRLPYLVLQTFRAMKRFTEKKRVLAENVQIQIEASQYQRRLWVFRQIKARYHQSQRLYQVFWWTYLQISRQILKKYLKHLKTFTRRRKLKRNAPLLFQANLAQKCFCRLKMAGLRQQKHRAIFEYIGQKQAMKLRRDYLVEWHNQFLKSKVLDERSAHHIAMKQKKAFHHLKVYAIAKRQSKSLFSQRVAAFNLYKKQKALQKFRQITLQMQIDTGKNKLVEQFKADHLVQKAFRGWMDYFKENYNIIQLSLTAKRFAEAAIRRRYMAKWVSSAWRSFHKIDSVRKLSNIRMRLTLKEHFQGWCSEVLHMIDLEHRIERFRHYQQQIFKQRALKLLLANHNTQRTLKERSRCVGIFSDRRALSRALRALAWYRQERFDKRELTNIARAYQAHQLAKRGYRGFKIESECRSRLKMATEMHRLQCRVRAAPRVLAALHYNQEHQILMRQKYSEATTFREFKAKDRGIRALEEYKIMRIEKRLRILSIQNYYQSRLEARTLKGMRDYTQGRILLRSKRECLTQVVQRADNQHKMQMVFDSIFQYVVQSSDDVQYAAQQLLVLKKRRLFQMILWNRDNQLSYRQAYQQVHSRATSAVKIIFFTRWRSELLKKQILYQFEAQRAMEMKRRVFLGFTQQYEQKRTEWKAIYEVKVYKAKKVLHALRGNVDKQKNKAAMRQMAVHKFEEKYVKQVFKRLKRHTEVLLKGRCLADQRRKIIVSGRLRSWGKLLRLKQQQLQNLKQLLIRKTLQTKHMHFQEWKRQAYLLKMCQKLCKAFEVGEYEAPDYQTELKESCFAALKDNRLVKAKHRKIHSQIWSKRVHRIKNTIFMEWVALLKDKILFARLKNILSNQFRQQFQCLKSFSEKECELQKIEMQFDLEKKLKLKHKILFNWVVLVGKRESVARLQADRQIRILQQSLLGLKSYWKKKEAEKIVQAQIVDNLNKMRPQVINYITKVFLIQCYETRKQGYSIATPKMVQGTEEEEEYGVPMCKTALAKYVFDKWKLALPILKRRNQMYFFADSRLRQLVKTKVFAAWRDQIQERQKMRLIKSNCDAIYRENALQKTFGGLLDYKRRRQTIHQLQNVGAELKSIRDSQACQRILATWYEMMLRSVQDESRFDQLIEEFRHISLQNRMQLCLHALRDFSVQRRQKEQVKQNVMLYAQEVYVRNIYRKALGALRAETIENRHQTQLSRLYTIFQAWKFFVKENKLLRKYLNEADESFQPRNDSINRGGQSERMVEEYDDQDSSFPEGTLDLQNKSPFEEADSFLYQYQSDGLGSTSKFRKPLDPNEEQKSPFQGKSNQSFDGSNRTSNISLGNFGAQNIQGVENEEMSGLGLSFMKQNTSMQQREIIRDMDMREDNGKPAAKRQTYNDRR